MLFCLTNDGSNNTLVQASQHCASAVVILTVVTRILGQTSSSSLDLCVSTSFFVPDRPFGAAITEGAGSPRADRQARLQSFGARGDSHHPRHLQRQAADVRRRSHTAAAAPGSPGNGSARTFPPLVSIY